MQKITLKWQDPLKFAQKIANNYSNNNSWAFLYSGLNNDHKNSISYIAFDAKDKITGNDFEKTQKIIKNSNDKWFGYLSYEVGRNFEKLDNSKESFINLDSINLVNFSIILEFNHSKKQLEARFKDKSGAMEKLNKILQSSSENFSKNKAKIAKIDSNFSDDSYIRTIEKIKKMIANGDFYQTNLTRKFFGKLQRKNNIKDNFATFLELSKLSPANYSSFLKLDDCCIISSSPELFLEAKNNKILSRPIKGTSPRGATKKDDLANKLYLKNSTKERAENLMIVDLVRNDLSRICEAGSVKVKNIFKISTYKNIYHMSSEIYGKIASKFCAFDAIKACFPAGSMTGAPKIKAMKVAAKEEGLNRGIYSGAIGIFAKDYLNCSVVIRTIIIQNNKFEFQVGGAITFDSDSKLELAETFNKAKALMRCLNIEEKKL